MLTIQPKISNNSTTFGRNKDRRLSPEELEEKNYQTARREIEEQQDDFLELAENKDLHLPKTAKKVIAGGAIVTTGLLGGMATGWGAKQSIKAFKKLGQTKAMQGLKEQAKATTEFISKTAKNVKADFVKSKAYTTPKAKFDKFAQTKFGKPIVKFFKAIGNGISFVYNKIKAGVNYVKGKIKSVKAETYEKAAVNTTAASGGIASGVTAIKEQSEKGSEE